MSAPTLFGEWTHRIARSPWPERQGLRCRIVTNGPRHYPFTTKAKGEVVILVENDPLTIRYDAAGNAPRGWSCVLDATDLEELTDG